MRIPLSSLTLMYLQPYSIPQSEAEEIWNEDPYFDKQPLAVLGSRVIDGRRRFSAARQLGYTEVSIKCIKGNG